MEIFGSYCEYCCNGVVILWYFFIEGKHVQCSFFFFLDLFWNTRTLFPNYGPGVSVSMISYPFLAGPYPYPYPQVPHPYVLASWPDLSLTTYCTAHRLKYVVLAELYGPHTPNTGKTKQILHSADWMIQSRKNGLVICSRHWANFFQN